MNICHENSRAYICGILTSVLCTYEYETKWLVNLDTYLSLLSFPNCSWFRWIYFSTKIKNIMKILELEEMHVASSIKNGRN